MSIAIKVAGWMPAPIARVIVEVTLAYYMINAMAKARRFEA